MPIIIPKLEEVALLFYTSCTTLDLNTLEGFTVMVANEGLEKAEPIEPGPPGPTALHPLRRMRCELFQVKRLQEHFLG